MTWILNCLTIGLLHTSLQYVFERARSSIMKATQTLLSIYRNIPTLVRRLATNVTITGIVAI